MALRVSDLQSESDLDSTRNSCDVFLFTELQLSAYLSFSLQNWLDPLQLASSLVSSTTACLAALLWVPMMIRMLNFYLEKWWGRRGRGYKWQSTSDRSWNSQKFQEWSTSIFMGSSVLPHKSILSFIATSPIYRHPEQFIQPGNINNMQSSVQRVTWDF